MEDGSLKFTFKGHLNIIHEISWNSSDYFLASCSSDYQVKIWSIQQHFFDEIDKAESENFNLIGSIKHPSYVYSVKFVPYTKLKNLYMLVTACFDAKLRVYSFEIGSGPRANIVLLNEIVIS